MSKKEQSDGSTAGYYELPEGAKELQELISHRNMNAQIGEVFRACYRYGLVSHSDMLRDAKKIKFYAEAEIARLEKLQQSALAKPCQSHGEEVPKSKDCIYCTAKPGQLHEQMCPIAIEGRIRNNHVAGRADYCKDCGFLSGSHAKGCPTVRTGQFCAMCGLSEGHGHAPSCPRAMPAGNKNCCAHGKPLTAPCPDCFDPAG